MYCFVVPDYSRICSFVLSKKLNKLLKRLITLILASESILRQKKKIETRAFKSLKDIQGCLFFISTLFVINSLI